MRWASSTPGSGGGGAAGGAAGGLAAPAAATGGVGGARSVTGIGTCLSVGSAVGAPAGVVVPGAPPPRVNATAVTPPPTTSTPSTANQAPRDDLCGRTPVPAAAVPADDDSVV